MFKLIPLLSPKAVSNDVQIFMLHIAPVMQEIDEICGEIGSFVDSPASLDVVNSPWKSKACVDAIVSS